MIWTKTIFDENLLLNIIKGLTFKKVNSKLLFQKINTIIKEKKFLDKLNPIQLIKILEAQNLFGKNTRDIEICRNIFKRKLPNSEKFIAS